VIVNFIDLVIKVVILTFILYRSFKIPGTDPPTHPLLSPHVKNLFLFTGICAALNVIMGTLASWKHFANKYLHYNALGTWILLFLQGK